jgi:hypothetical protein
VLLGRARGRFRTVGRYAAAGIRGTDWVTADRCDGTFLSDNQGRVETASRNGAIKSPTLSAGDSSVYRCAQHGLAPVSASYCVAVEGFVQHTVLNGKPAVLHKYVAALATKSPAGERTELCITTPSLMTSCTQYPLAPPDPSGYRSSTVGCYATEGGDYTITYRLDGVQLGAPLVYHSPAASSVAATCEASLGKPDPGIFSSPLATNLKAVNRYVLPTPAIVGFEDIYLGPGVSSGRQLIRGVVYADTNGAPGRLLDSTEQLVYTRARGKRWAVLNFNPYLPLPAGVYWIGLISGGTPGVAAFYSDHVAGVLDINRNAYAQGPSDPFGPFVRGANLISLYLDYLVGTETAK